MARLPGIHLLVAQQFIQHTAVACQTIVRLGKIANLQAGSKLHLAGERIELTQESLQETGLAAAVGTDQGGTFAPPQFHVGCGEQRVAGISHRQLAGAQDNCPA